MAAWFNLILHVLKGFSTEGIYLPYARDTVKRKPSVTLLFAYIAFFSAVASLSYLHLAASPIVATSATIVFFWSCMIFYRMGKIDSAKLDLDDKSIELSSNGKQERAAKTPATKKEDPEPQD